MELLDALAKPFAGLVPRVEPGTVTDVASALGEPLLWSGAPGSAPDVWIRYLAVAAFGGGLLLVLAVSAGILARGRKPMARGMLATVSASLVLVAGLLGFTGFQFYEGARRSARAFVITPNRIVVLAPDGRRDIPATDIRGVEAVTGGVRISLGGGKGLAIPAARGEEDILVRAARTAWPEGRGA